jgi:hypothetical protein
VVVVEAGQVQDLLVVVVLEADPEAVEFTLVGILLQAAHLDKLVVVVAGE